jgi:hypothetical protein
MVLFVAELVLAMKLGDFLTKDIVSSKCESNSVNVEALYHSNVPRNVQRAHVRNIDRTVNILRERSEEGKPIHIIGIIPDKMVSSYENDQSVSES